MQTNLLKIGWTFRYGSNMKTRDACVLLLLLLLSQYSSGKYAAYDSLKKKNSILALIGYYYFISTHLTYLPYTLLSYL